MMEVFHEIISEFFNALRSINKRKLMTRLIMVIAICALTFGGCSYLNKRFAVDDDNPLEEAVEDVIRNRTGIDVDLTPDSKEMIMVPIYDF